MSPKMPRHRAGFEAYRSLVDTLNEVKRARPPTQSMRARLWDFEIEDLLADPVGEDLEENEELVEQLEQTADALEAQQDSRSFVAAEETFLFAGEL